MTGENSRRLTIELVPSTSWFTNLRSILPAGEWDKIRRESYRAAGYVCEVCGGRGPNHPVEAHEIWEYDGVRHVQKLVGIVSLCPSCHEVKHIGLAQMRGNLERAVGHLANVNGVSRREANALVTEAFDTWRERSEHRWTVDVSLVTDADFESK